MKLTISIDLSKAGKKFEDPLGEVRGVLRLLCLSLRNGERQGALHTNGGNVVGDYVAVDDEA